LGDDKKTKVEITKSKDIKSGGGNRIGQRTEQQ